ncbi:MAG: di-trans,poly-cis-decaprenylcistransferase [Candidatus Aenigmarchaeota archaeon]|nr:di-trans,poly-cis-decaprenylcistransferase [Candidatus Aenigmarchaeota archaeon]
MKGTVTPAHIGVILDGNRRWAVKNSMKPWQGHAFGADKLEKLFEWCVELEIPKLSVFALSTENLNRPKREVNALLSLFQKELEKMERDEKGYLDKYEVRMRFIGDLPRLPMGLRKIMQKIMKKTEKYNRRVFNIMVAYGGKFELTQAVKKIAQKAIETGIVTVTEKDIKENLLVKDDIDLLIRTGGENRISNFMPWQVAYAELIIMKKCWPDFNKKDLVKCIKEYSKRQRRFGY